VTGSDIRDWIARRARYRPAGPTPGKLELIRREEADEPDHEEEEKRQNAEDKCHHTDIQPC